MKTVADALKVSRSNLMNKVRKPRVQYKKSDGTWLLPMIHGVVGNKPSYGYRRVTALLNRQLISERKLVLNYKRIYRVIEEHRLLLQKHTGKSIRTHDGESSRTTTSEPLIFRRLNSP